MAEDMQAALERLRGAVASAERNRNQAEFARSQAEKAVGDSMAAMKQEFGVDTVEAAEKILADLDAKILAEVREIEIALGAPNGG